jgi:hypothetical protein
MLGFVVFGLLLAGCPEVDDELTEVVIGSAVRGGVARLRP